MSLDFPKIGSLLKMLLLPTQRTSENGFLSLAFFIQCLSHAPGNSYGLRFGGDAQKTSFLLVDVLGS